MEGINFFQKYLSIWVALCMVAGVMIGQYVPIIPETLGQYEVANISIPIAILIWVMIYPMMMKVDFESVKNVGKNPKGLYVTWIANWLIKPFTMFAIAWVFFFVLFKPWINVDFASMELLHARLIRTNTCVDGCRCDYTICGDKDPYLKGHPEYRDEAGFRRNR